MIFDEVADTALMVFFQGRGFCRLRPIQVEILATQGRIAHDT
jgi:hypothetical protein